MSGNFLTIPGDDPIQRRSRFVDNLDTQCLESTPSDNISLQTTSDETTLNDRVTEEPLNNQIRRDDNTNSSSLTDLISAFDTKAQSHSDLQKVTAFSGHFDKNHKPTFSKDEYGKPIPGSMTEFRGAEAQARVCTEMKELCEIIHENGRTPSKGLLPPELADATKWITFGELFTIYTVINDKLVGLLIRTRKHHLTYFEGEVLFQKRDDDVPIFLMQSIDEIRSYCNNKAQQARRSVSPMPQ